MKKRGKRFFVHNLALTEVFLLLFSIFSFGFLISEINLTSAEEITRTNMRLGSVGSDAGNTITIDKTSISKTPAAPSGDPVAPRGITSIISDIYGGKAFGAEQGGISGIGSSLIGGAAWGFTVYGIGTTD